MSDVPRLDLPVLLEPKDECEQAILDELRELNGYFKVFARTYALLGDLIAQDIYHSSSSHDVRSLALSTIQALRAADPERLLFPPGKYTFGGTVEVR